MRSLIFKLFFTLLAGAFILIFAIPWGYFGLAVPFSGPDYRLGLDLSGGIELDYRVDLSEVREEENYDQQRKNNVIEGLKGIIDRRIETLNINDSVITSASYGNEEHIIVQIPLKGNDALQSSENIERAKAAIGNVVRIEFKEAREVITDADIAEREELARNFFDELSESPENFIIESQRIVNNNENVFSGETQSLELVFEISSETGLSEETQGDTHNNENINLNEDFNKSSGEIVRGELVFTEAQDVNGNDGFLIYREGGENIDYIFVDRAPSIWQPATDSQGRVLNDRYFVNSSVQYNEAFQPLVELTFNSEGADIFGELTRRLVGEPMAIFVGGELLTAPTINEPILTGRAVITGDYSPESAAELSRNINTGVVPAPIYLTSERTIDARLGQNSLKSIIIAGVIGFISILIFLGLVYRSSGIIAAVALFVYVAITLAILKQFGVVLTLATIAGLVLSIGIAIDANILIFERIKDELRGGLDIRNAQRVGFEKSFSAIWDANVTGFIVAVILFIFGINLIKGFGFILALGIIVSLFSVFFISRLFIRLLARTHVSTKNFIGKI